ncbi:hypothetical protein M0D69_02865 [Caballeronia sp. SEWSISQ10-4 2]|uniref:hypothetical protein n=1 Tax=Caballeronia sp. SEWSISQ10-4 2 TaxID=2937438 RepID=UPI00264BAF2E|nr:hypothetical protein [Caballeronia sp. SEWSISQ10-4 2]MDN7176976.1 hypothetical protein [Caballeronia sp. SEWSISQ10-4 2]
MDLAKLDYWVSCAEQVKGRAADQDTPLVVRPYASDPTLAASIISREHIVIGHIVDDERGEMAIAWIDPVGDVNRHPVGASIWMGETECEAAMLCYVSACFGDALLAYDENPAPDADSPLN